MKNLINQLSNILFVIIIVFLIYRIGTSYIQNNELEGRKLPEVTLLQLNDLKSELKATVLGKDILPPYILIFWSSTCPPCLVELARFSEAIKEKDIPVNRFIAINVGENIKEVKKYLSRKNYKFPVYFDRSNKLASFLKLSSTPLVVHVGHKGNIKWISTGVSPTGIIRAKKLLKSK